MFSTVLLFGGFPSLIAVLALERAGDHQSDFDGWYESVRSWITDYETFIVDNCLRDIFIWIYWMSIWVLYVHLFPGMSIWITGWQGSGVGWQPPDLLCIELIGVVIDWCGDRPGLVRGRHIYYWPQRAPTCSITIPKHPSEQLK